MSIRCKLGWHWWAVDKRKFDKKPTEWICIRCGKKKPL